MKSGWTQSARLLGNVQCVVVQAIILVEGSSSSGKFMMTGGEGGSGGRRGGGKGERSGQTASEGRVRDREMDLPANLGFPNQQVKKNPEDCTLNLGEEGRVGQGMYLFRNSNLGRA